MKKKSLSVLIALTLATTTLVPATGVFAATATTVTTAPASTYAVEYTGHVQNIGWQTPVTVTGDQTDITGITEAGTDGRGLRVEALKIAGVNLPAGASITYQAHVQNVGWQPAVTSDSTTTIDTAKVAGTSGKSLRVEALKLTLNGLPGYAIKYQGHVQNVGWQPAVTVENGTAIDTAAIAGTTGKSLRVEALRIEIVKTDAEKAAEVAAINAVAKAETSKTYDDVQAATTAVASVKDIAQNAALAGRIAAINENVQIVSVNAVNGNTVQVTFNKALDSTSVVAGNFTAIKLSDNSTYSFNIAELSADGKTVTLVANGADLTAATNYALNINGVKVSGTTTALTFSNQFTSLTDTTAPTIASASATTGSSNTSTVSVTFDEPVDITGTHAPIFTVNGSVVAATQSITDFRTFTLSLPSGVAAGTSLAIAATNVYDYAGNKGSVNTTATVASDLQAPVLNSVDVISDTVIKLTFNEAVDFNTLGLGNVFVTADGMSNAVSSVTDAAGVPLVANTNVAYVHLTAATLYPTGGATSRNLNVTLKNVADVYGNVTTSDLIKTVSIALDTVKPVPTAVTENKVTVGGVDKSTFLVQLSEPVTVNTGAGAFAIDLINADGVLTSNVATTASYVDATGAAVPGATSSKYILLTASNLISNGTYRISFAAGRFTDLASSPNLNVAATLTTSITDGQTAAAAAAPTIGSASVAGQVITVNYSKAVDVSATLAANYKLNNVVLPSNTLITLNSAKTQATITLPAGFVTKDIATPVLTVLGVKSTDGGQISTTTASVTGGTILETVAPVMTKVEYTALDTVNVYFNDNSIAPGTVLTIYNGSTAVGTVTTTGVTDGAVGDVDATVNGVVEEQLTVTPVGTGINALNQSGLTVKAVSGGLADANTNAIAADQVVTVTDKATVTAGTLAAVSAGTVAGSNVTFAVNGLTDVEAGSTAFVYVVRNGQAVIDHTNYTNYTAASVQAATNLKTSLNFAIATDSYGVALATGNYDVYVVIKDASGNTVDLNATSISVN